MQESEAVFSGEVLDARDNPSSTTPGLHFGPVAFDVEQSWKGILEEQVVVLGYGGGGDCGIDFRQGERYLVYAVYEGQGEDAALTTSTCQGTKPLASAGDDLEALGPAQIELPETEEGPDESKIREVLEAVSGGEDGLTTVQEGPGIHSTQDPKLKDKGKGKSKEKAPKKGEGRLPSTGEMDVSLALGAGALLVGGLLLVRRAVR